MKNIFAFTETDYQPNIYPGYISINRNDDHTLSISIREGGNDTSRSANLEVSAEVLTHLATNILAFFGAQGADRPHFICCGVANGTDGTHHARDCAGTKYAGPSYDKLMDLLISITHHDGAVNEFKPMWRQIIEAELSRRQYERSSQMEPTASCQPVYQFRQKAGGSWMETDEACYLGFCKNPVFETRTLYTSVPVPPTEAGCRDDGRCQYAIDTSMEEYGRCPEGKCQMPRKQGTLL